MIDNFKEIITQSKEETFDFGKDFVKKLKGGEVICLSGDLGAGKTTFVQGLINGLGIEGTVNSPTFVVMKEYTLQGAEINIKKIFHIDTYRVGVEDIIEMGWEEITSNKENIVIVEWPEKIKDIVSPGSIWLNFEYIEENKRKISF